MATAQIRKFLAGTHREKINFEDDSSNRFPKTKTQQLKIFFCISLIILSVSWMNGYAQENCPEFKEAFTKKDTIMMSKAFRQNLKYDDCTIHTIDLIVGSIASGNVSIFNLRCLHIFHAYVDGYASEYLAVSIEKIVSTQFKKFLRASFTLEKSNVNCKLFSLLADSEPFLKNNISLMMKKYSSQLPPTDTDFKNYMEKIVANL